eukprot:5308094-Alexandrium_andersonii.AAC.1
MPSCRNRWAGGCTAPANAARRVPSGACHHPAGAPCGGMGRAGTASASGSAAANSADASSTASASKTSPTMPSR